MAVITQKVQISSFFLFLCLFCIVILYIMSKQSRINSSFARFDLCIVDEELGILMMES